MVGRQKVGIEVGLDRTGCLARLRNEQSDTLIKAE
jgi:hypothetical protein